MITKMNISSRSTSNNPRAQQFATATPHKDKFEVDRDFVKSMSLRDDIMEDLNWCIYQLSNATSQKFEVAQDKLKNKMDVDLIPLKDSHVNSERMLAAYLKNFMGTKRESVELKNKFYFLDQATISEDKNDAFIVGQTLPNTTDIVNHVMNNGARVVQKNPLISLLERRDKWGLDIFKVAEYTSNRPLMTVVYAVMEDWDFQRKFHIPMETLMNNLLHVENQYRPYLPYHNSLHACDIFVSSNNIIAKRALENVFTDLEAFAALYAAACHDIDHPGVTNPYLVRIKSRAAELYEDKSVLEHHHIATTLRILNNDKFNILKNMKARDVRIFKNILSAVILATDHAHHMPLLTDLSLIAESKDNVEEGFLVNYVEKVKMLQGIIHCCDISNPLKPLDQYKNWADRIMTEFFHQGDMEKEKNLEPSPMCDREVTSVSKGQVGFIDHVVKPIWVILAEILRPECDEMLKLMEENKEYYRQLNSDNQQNRKMLYSNYTTVVRTSGSDLTNHWGIDNDEPGIEN